MSIKPARQSFNREEILDIIRRNVALYKDEEGFVDYLTDLSAYLFQYTLDEESVSALREDPLRPPTPPVVRTLDPDLDPAVLPPTVEQLRRRSGEVARPGSLSPEPYRMVAAPPPPRTPPPAPPREGPPKPSRAGSPQPPPADESKPVRRSQIFQVKPAGARFRRPTDMPESESSEAMPKAPIEREPRPSPGSRPRVVRLSRPQSSSVEFPCQICGASIPATSRRCPGCGAEVL